MWKTDKWYTVEDLYKFCTEFNVPLLPVTNSPEVWPWWASYEDDHAVIDRLFNKHYRTFRPITQDPSKGEENDIAQMYVDWSYSVNALFFTNNKKYSELYKIMTHSFNANPALDYSETESKTETRNLLTEETLGNRSDSNTRTVGQKTISDNTTLGSRSDSSSNTRGSATDTSENQIAGFNSSGYNNANKTTDIYGQRIDSANSTIGSQSNSNTRTENQYTIGDAFTKGAQENEIADTGTVTTSKTVNGVSGRRTLGEILKEYQDFWGDYNFYFTIFEDICKEFLLV